MLQLGWIEGGNKIRRRLARMLFQYSRKEMMMAQRIVEVEGEHINF
jgi:hypothetical protein